MAISYDEYIKQTKKKKEEPKVVLGYSKNQNNVKNTPRSTTNTQTLIDKYIAEQKAREDIAPVKTVPKTKDKRTWLDAGAFSDGYQAGDVTKTILGTAADIGVGVTKGIFNMAEGIVDLGRYGVSGAANLLGAKQYAKDVKETAQENTTEKWFSPMQKYLDKYSVIGDKGQSIPEGLGYVGGMIATGGMGGAIGSAVGGTAKAVQVGATIATTGTTFTSAMGSGMSQAYQEGATDEEAVTYGVISGLAEAGTELIFGGLGKTVNAVGLNTGLSSADDMLAKKISSIFKSQIAKNIASTGVKMTAEGTEEVIAGVIQAWGQKLTYMSEEEIQQLIEDQELLEAFISGAIVSGIAQSPSVIKDTKAGRDYITGYTQNEQEAIDKLTNERIVEQEREGITLTKKEKAAIQEQVRNEIKEGKVKINDVDDIAPIYEDSALTNEKRGGGQADVREEEIALQEEAPVLENVATQEETTTQGYTAAGLTPIETTVEADETVLKSQNYVYQASETDSTYRRNLNEDATKYANNTTRTHEFVNTLANVSEASGIDIRLTNNTSPEMTQRKQAMINSYAKRNNVSVQEASERLKNIVIDGYNVNDQITINVNSPKALNRLVGHEITHSLEKTTQYKTKLQKIAIEYAKSKNDYKSRLDRLIDLYEGQNADINKELTADIIGDYLFTDQKFVDNLYKKDRNLFQRIFDEIKHLIKMATAGSKEARELEKLKHSFEKAMQENKEMSKESKKATVQETKDKSAVEVESNTQEKEDSVQKTEKTETSNVNESVETETKTEDKAESKIEENVEEDSLGIVDSEGNKLSEAQIEFFEDSVVRDENGNLLVMYHGTSSGGYTVFDPYGGRPGLFGQGSYFTDNKSVAESYTQKGKGKNQQIYEVYLNITNPIDMDAQANVEEWEKYFSKHIPDAKFPESGTNEELYRFTLEEFENTEYDRFEVAEIMIETFQKMGYDGITHIGGGRFKQKDDTRHRVYITFESNQAKDIDNKNPTEDSDIRYSLSDRTDAEVREALLDMRNFSSEKSVKEMREQIAEQKPNFFNEGTDNLGRKLSKGMKNFMKDSQVRDVNDSLTTVYHTINHETVQFNEFNPVGTPGYKYDDQIVNFYTNSKDMSGSYAGQRYDMADTKKLNNLEEAKQWLEENVAPYLTQNKVEIEELKDGKYRVKYTSLEDEGVSHGFIYDSLDDLLRNIKSEEGRNPRYAKYQYEGYINITNPYVVDAEGRSWGDVSQSVDTDKISRLENLSQSKKAELIELAQESKDRYDIFIGSGKNSQYYSMRKAIQSQLSEMEQYHVMLGLALDNPGQLITYWQGNSQITDNLERFVKEYKELEDVYKNEGESPRTYFNTKYSEVVTKDSPIYGIDRIKVYGVARDNFKNINERFTKSLETNDMVKQVIEMNKNGSDYDGVIFKNVIDYGGKSNGDPSPSDVYVTFNSNQFKAWDNENPTDDPDIRYSLSESGSIEDKINSSMTMAEARKMIQIAFQENNINEWQDEGEKYIDGDDWLNKVGVDEVATYIENTESTIINYLNPLYDRDIGYGEDYYVESIIEAYQNGTLKGSPRPEATRLNTSVSNNYQDVRFYAPREVEATLELYDKANQRVTNKNRDEVYKARADFIIATHQKGTAEQLGLTQEEVNKKIKSWANYTDKARKLSNQLNENVAFQNRWSGIENSSILNTFSVSNEDLGKMVKEIKGDSNNWQRQYITSTMLALDTHIDYSKLTFEFDQHQALRQESALGDYNRRTKTIRIGDGYQNTVAHEIGHYIDNKWAEDFGFYNTANLTSGLNFESTTLSDEAKQFNKNFQLFMDDLVKSATAGYGSKTSYYQDRGEVFARFVGKFVEWTKNQATNNRYGYEDKYYTDSFTERQYREFVKLLQEKSMLDTTEIQHSLSRVDDIAPVGENDIFGSDIAVQEQVKEAIAPLQEQIETLTKTISDLQENMAPASFDLVEEQRAETQRTMTDEDAPLTDEGTFTFLDDEIKVKKKNEIINDIASDFNIKKTEARELYNKIDSIPEVTIDDVYTELENYRKVKFKEQDDYIKSIQDYIKGTRLDISEIKKQIPDYGNVYRMSNMGKGLILGNSGQSIDSFYQELNELYPNEFPGEVTAEADQLELISQAMFKEKELTYTDVLDDDELQILAERIYADIGNSERYRHTQSGLYFLNREVKKMAPPGEINTNVSEEEYADSLPTLNASNTEQIEENVSLDEELNELDRQKGPSITKNPFDEVLDKFLEGKRTQKTAAVTPKVEKSKYRNAVDTAQRLFVNEMVESDNLAKETGNLNIKYTGDMLNNVAGEIEGEIYTAQTDNEGHQIGKSLSALFSEARKTGLYDAFNDYLEQYSNIDRHAQGKGSVVPLADSQRLVRHYEKTYPEFKKWGKDVWQYGANIRNNLIDAGIINEEFAETLGTMYPHYVPYMENREMSNYNPDLGEIKPKGVIKRAVGGADNLLPIEDALTKYTFASKKAVRQNQFYQEIVSTLDSKAEVGADVRNDAVDLEDTLYKDETGNYLTAYFNGERLSVRISDDLYTGLRNDLKGQIRGLEEKFALITDPVQKLSEIRRNLLTSWNPMFIIKNPIMDIQDALFNSKYTKDFMKNYPGAFIELGQAKSETAKQFLTLYGSGNVMGEYSSDGTVKNRNFLKGIQKANNVMELAPRYAEFKASLENGATLEEAMYNAREVTTNFGRGGVITKALNKNGFTFLNVSVQGFDKFLRNFSGDNGAKGVAGSLLKATLLGVIPAIFNELAFGGDDEEKDEDYDALPDYIKDNYYLIKTGDGEFIRIPKGRMLSVFGSAARRTLEYMQGEEDAFEGFLKNANSQIGVSNPLDSNIFTPLIQAYGSENGEAWYGGDLVPTRLQDKAPEEQYDASTDKFSIWLGDKLGISPYKLNYVIDQYTGGMGDIFLPFITEESTSDAEGVEMALAPFKDQFTANSTSDNKYAGDIYDLSDKMDKMPSSVKETDEYKIQDAYLYSVTSEMGKLYAERRAVQENKKLSKKEKYEKVQAIQKQINDLAKEGLDNYQEINSTKNYAIVGGREFNKYKTESGETRWGAVREDELEALNSYGLDIMEKSSYFNAKTYISEAQDKYRDSEDYTQKKRDIISVIKSTLLTDEAKAYLYDKYYGNTDALNTVVSLGIDFDKFLDFEYQNFEADKNAAGKSISGSKKAKVFNYINSMDLSFEEKLVLTKLQYNSYDEHNGTVINYINNSDLTYEQRVNILKKLGFKVDDYGNIFW